MSQQVPLENNDITIGNNRGSADFGPLEISASAYNSSGAESEYVNSRNNLPPRSFTQNQQSYARNRVPMIDPIESAKLTPQILVLLILSGLKRHWRWSLPLGLILGLLTAGTLYLAFPIQYGATASLHIRSSIQQILSTERRQDRYNEFVHTQIAIIRSPKVLDGSLETADIAKLPIVLKQKDRRVWLQKKIQVSAYGGSEIVNIHLETDDGAASEKIVNAVVDSYLAFIRNATTESSRGLLAELLNERRKQQSAAQTLQTSIRSNSVQAALQGAAAGNSGMSVGLGQGESLMRDMHIEEARLTAMQAARKASLDRIETPNQIPHSVLVQLDPELTEITSRREELILRRESIAVVLGNADEDPRIKILDRQIRELDQRINEIAGDTDGKKKIDVQNRFRVQEEYNLYLIDQNIREQEILVETLKKKYEEQLKESASRAGEIVDVSFDQAQLERSNKTIGIIEDRILEIQSSQVAPAQITPLSRATLGSPNRQKQIMVVGGGAAVMTFFPVIFSIFIERIKPRLYHISQVRRSVPQVLLGEIMEPPVSWIQGAAFRKRLARYRESVHNWCTHLLLSDPFRSCRTLSVASVAGDDGKTFLAVQIAAAMAQMKGGNVLLIDGDMRVGRLHLLFGNEEAGIGLADVLAFRHGFGEAMVQNEKEPNLHLLSAGQLDVTPYELLGDGRFRELLDMLEQSYSLILVVLPPVSNAAESLIMAASTDSTLLCVRQGETVLAAMEDVYRKLINTGASVDGIVVKDIPYYQMAGKDGGFTDKLEQIRLSHLLQYSE